jgi:hypothetical protein
MEQVDQLGRDYDQACKMGDIDGARRSLTQMAHLSETLSVSEKSNWTPRSQASVSFAAFGLLYCFEKRIGNEVSVTADLIKMRYWQLIELELSGQSEAQAVAAVESKTGLAIIEMFHHSDKSGLLPSANSTRPAS